VNTATNYPQNFRQRFPQVSEFLSHIRANTYGLPLSDFGGCPDSFEKFPHNVSRWWSGKAKQQLEGDGLKSAHFRTTAGGEQQTVDRVRRRVKAHVFLGGFPKVQPAFCIGIHHSAH